MTRGANSICTELTDDHRHESLHSTIVFSTNVALSCNDM